LVGICSENLSTIVEVLRTKDLQETFVSKKKSREMRFLLNKWERVHNRIKENVQQTGVYGALKQDVISFKRDLAGLLERTEEPGHTEEDEELESRLHTFKDAMIELSDFKSHLFELNLSVHNFLAELNSSQMNGKSKFERAVHLKDAVIGLYTMWDRWGKRWHLEMRRQILNFFLQGAPSNSRQHCQHGGSSEETEMLRD